MSKIQVIKEVRPDPLDPGKNITWFFIQYQGLTEECFSDYAIPESEAENRAIEYAKQRRKAIEAKLNSKVIFEV